ncbi:hypothetical protein PI172_0371 [Prevotella intermedia]|uniref:Uncharacterized protein n=1 Tax=Prevotella intermedia TaxID=28131 RepID=A0AAD1BG91_PREIN|nr:hypothetical protein PI172_0371 [Prevotella intermedia]
MLEMQMRQQLNRFQELLMEEIMACMHENDILKKLLKY